MNNNTLKLCGIKGCGNKYSSKKLCSKHYLRMRRNGGPLKLKQHGLGKPPEYSSWAKMRQRCLNKNSTRYADWGGRGIKICAQWTSFAKFYEDMGPKPTPKHSLDRIDNNGDYEPSNCRWATPQQQSLNRRAKK